MRVYVLKESSTFSQDYIAFDVPQVASQAGVEPVGDDLTSDGPCQSQPVADEQQVDTAGHLQHLLEFPLEGTGTPRPAQLHPAISRQLHARALTVRASICCCAVLGYGEAGRALKALARRVRTFNDGEHSPSPTPHLLDKLTDDHLVVASDAAVAAVAAEGAVLSGKQQFR